MANVEKICDKIAIMSNSQISIIKQKDELIGNLFVLESFIDYFEIFQIFEENKDLEYIRTEEQEDFQNYSKILFRSKRSYTEILADFRTLQVKIYHAKMDAFFDWSLAFCKKNAFAITK